MLKHKLKKLKLCIVFFIKYITHRKKIVIFNAPGHGNIGDAALAQAEHIFFHKYFPKHCVLEVTGYMWNAKLFKFIMGKRAKIFLHAGGYLGDLWPSEDAHVKEVMEVFKNNPKIIMPQSIYLKNTDNKEDLIRETKEIYNSYSNLFVFMREKYSFDFLRNEIFDNEEQCALVPDITLIMDYSHIHSDRNGVLCCLRHDIEQTLSKEEQQNIKEILEQNNISFRFTDTVVPYPIDNKNRVEEIEKKLNEFSKSRLVITDRLHGMIFATITGTPCIGLNNISRKVQGVYEWIKDIPYVMCTDKITEQDIKKMMKIHNAKYDASLLESYYDEMAQIIKDKMKKM